MVRPFLMPAVKEVLEDAPALREIIREALLRPRSGFAPMAHPDWKFGTVVVTNTTKVKCMVVRRAADFWHGIVIWSPSTSYPAPGTSCVFTTDDVQLVAEPDD